MWKIIKAEYEDSLFTGIWKILLGVIFLSFIFNEKTESIIVYLFAASTVLPLRDNRIFYLYQILPVSNKQIAYTRLIVLVINYVVLLIIVIPFIIYNQTDWIENLSKLLITIGIIMLIRLFSISLFDVIFGYFSKRQRINFIQLISFSLILTYVVISIYFRKPEMKMMLMAVIYSSIPLLAYISKQTFIGKEKISIREE